MKYLRLFDGFSYLHLPKISCRSISSKANRYYKKELLLGFDRLLRECTCIRQCRQLHAQIYITGTIRTSFLTAEFVSTYSAFGYLNDAQRAFDTSPIEFSSDVLLWNSILRVHLKYGEYEEVVRLYLRMRKLGVEADGYTFPVVIRACAFMGDPRLCKNLHSHIVHSGLQCNNLHVANELLCMYGKIREMSDARRLFDRMLVKSLISWNTMISGYAFNNDCRGAFDIFCMMENTHFVPNHVTWTSLLSSHARCGNYEETLRLFNLMRRSTICTTAETLAVVISVCADLWALNKNKAFHGYVIKGGFDKYLFVMNSLISMYGKQGAVRDANYLFSEMEIKNRISWNALISSFAESGLCDEAFDILSRMENSSEHPVLRPDIISWSAVIGGFALKGRGEDCFEIFRQMQLAKVSPNCIMITSILSVCTEFSSLRIGREVHGHVTKFIMNGNIIVGNGLIKMYSRCGSLKEAYSVFEKIDCKDLISWNTMINGYGMHGLASDAFKTFELMINDGHEPDEVSFVALLSACSHVGLVDEGKKIFDQMKREFRIEPQLEHYACIVDLLGRAGLLQEAADIVNNMPMEPSAFVWGSLLNSCRLYRNTDFAKSISSRIFNLDYDITGSYILLSNIYANAGRWEDSARVRISARTKGLKKIAGQSWIEVKKKVYTFSSGNAFQIEWKDIYKVLKDLSLQMEMDGCLPDKKLKSQESNEEIYAC